MTSSLGLSPLPRVVCILPPPWLALVVPAHRVHFYSRPTEILREQAYRALPAEIWTLGVLLCFLVTGESPFPDTEHAIQGRPLFADLRMDGTPLRLSADCKDLIRGCLRPDPDKRFTIKEIKTHRVSPADSLFGLKSRAEKCSCHLPPSVSVAPQRQSTS